MWVKICANSNLIDTKLAADAGANAVGFVFAPSKRQVTGKQVAAITPGLPSSLKKIGVFDSRSLDEITSTVRAAGLNGAQLHDGLDLLLTEKLRKEFGSEFFLIQTLHWLVEDSSGEAEQKFRNALRAVVRHNCVDAVLLDAKTATASGGTGTSFDWVRARAVLDDEAGSLYVIVAGGLTAGNVAEAIRVCKPWGVDVASGTEIAPGKKDAEKIREFIAAVRAME